MFHVLAIAQAVRSESTAGMIDSTSSSETPTRGLVAEAADDWFLWRMGRNGLAASEARICCC